MKEIERIIGNIKCQYTPDGTYELDSEDKVIVKAIEKYVQDCESVALAHGLLSSELHKQEVIKARIEVAQKAPYLVIDGKVVSKNQFIAELKKGLNNVK